MATATAPRTFVDELIDRWHQDDHRQSEGTSGDVREDAGHLVKNLMVGDYWQWEQSDGFDAALLGPKWLNGLEQAAERAAREAFDAHVVPAIARAIDEYMRENRPPAHLVAFDESNALRADLDLLDVEPGR